MTHEDDLRFASRPPLARKKCKTLTSALNFAANRGLPNPWQRFCANRQQAKNRGIGWRLSFDEWWALWMPYYSERGVGKGKYCLCRYLDLGGYEVGNVRIDTTDANHREYGVGLRLKKQTLVRDKIKDTIHFSVISMELRDPLEILLAREDELEFI